MNKTKIGLGMIVIAIMFVIVGISYGSESKYDLQVSKFDVGYQSFRWKFDEQEVRCIETSLKEREAILADIKSGRFKMKLHPDWKDAIYLSNNFATEKEYLYFGSSSTCTKFNKETIIDHLKGRI